MNPAIARLIEALAKQAARDYLTAQAAQRQAPRRPRTEPVRLRNPRPAA